MKPMSWLLISLSIVFVSGTVGCGAGFRSNVGDNVNVFEELRKAEEASLLAEEAMAEANMVLREIMDDQGNINVGLFRSGSTAEVETQFILSGLTNKLREVFNKVFEKVALVKAQFQVARDKLNEAASKLDPSNPAHALQLQAIQAQIAKINALEAQFSAQMHSLASKLDLAINGLDKIISGVTSWIPGWGSIVGLALDFFVMSDVKALILEIKHKLMSI